jgi:hypothetical protein
MNAKPHISGLITFFVLISTVVVAQQNQNKDKKAPPPPMSFFITSTGSGNGANLGGLAAATLVGTRLTPVAAVARRIW